MQKQNQNKIYVPTWYDKFELSDESYPASDIQDYFQSKNYELLTSKDMKQ